VATSRLPSSEDLTSEKYHERTGPVLRGQTGWGMSSGNYVIVGMKEGTGNWRKKNFGCH
jgi:hypothetical protein